MENLHNKNYMTLEELEDDVRCKKSFESHGLTKLIL